MSKGRKRNFPRVRVCVDLNGNPRCIMSLGDNQKRHMPSRHTGSIKKDRAAGEAANRSPERGIAEMRYSIHPSNNSRTGINTIKMTLICDDDSMRFSIYI